MCREGGDEGHGKQRLLRRTDDRNRGRDTVHQERVEWEQKSETKVRQNEEVKRAVKRNER